MIDGVSRSAHKMTRGNDRSLSVNSPSRSRESYYLSTSSTTSGATFTEEEETDDVRAINSVHGCACVLAVCREGQPQHSCPCQEHERDEGEQSTEGDEEVEAEDFTEHEQDEDEESSEGGETVGPCTNTKSFFLGRTVCDD